jgi:hypothetical protein
MSDAQPAATTPPAGPPPGQPALQSQPQSQPPRRSRPWLTVVLCVLIFLAGGVAGAGAMAVHTLRRVREAVHHPEVIPERIVSRLRRPLDLDPQQELQIKAILARRQASLLEARAAAMQRARPDFEGIEADIAAILRPDQVDTWHKLYERFLSDWVPERFSRGPDGLRSEDLEQLGYIR